MKTADVLSGLQDAFDERRARRLRDELGGDGILVSWERMPDETWKARASMVRGKTVERIGMTRVDAVELAAGAVK